MACNSCVEDQLVSVIEELNHIIYNCQYRKNALEKIAEIMNEKCDECVKEEVKSE